MLQRNFLSEKASRDKLNTGRNCTEELSTRLDVSRRFAAVWRVAGQLDGRNANCTALYLCACHVESVVCRHNDTDRSCIPDTAALFVAAANSVLSVCLTKIVSSLCHCLLQAVRRPSAAATISLEFVKLRDRGKPLRKVSLSRGVVRHLRNRIWKYRQQQLKS